MTGFYQVAREAMVNISKHAEASQVRITLKMNSDDRKCHSTAELSVAEMVSAWTGADSTGGPMGIWVFSCSRNG